MGSGLGRAIERRSLCWLTKRIQIFRVERAERGFDRGAEAGYAVAQIATKKRHPGSGADKKFWRANSGGTSGVELAINIGALLGGNFIEVLRGHSITQREGLAIWTWQRARNDSSGKS